MCRWFRNELEICLLIIFSVGNILFTSGVFVVVVDAVAGELSQGFFFSCRFDGIWKMLQEFGGRLNKNVII